MKQDGERWYIRIRAIKNIKDGKSTLFLYNNLIQINEINIHILLFFISINLIWSCCFFEWQQTFLISYIPQQNINLSILVESSWKNSKIKKLIKTYHVVS